jgi:aerobic-type carbon monoxide dehydrogenase small subunit (CoxS/CutS family)
VKTMLTLQFTLNGEEVETIVAAHRTLLEMLRDTFHLTGAKRGCEEGECGACTVLLDGQAVTACLVMAPAVSGRSVETIEGLASDGRQLHPIQQAFVDHGAIQCGFCTPGLIMMTKAFLAENPHPTADEIRAGIAGNLCRCTGYAKIVEAVQAAVAAQ